jgi:hypothetical protein
MDAPTGRGQRISQFIAYLGREQWKRLPKPIKVVPGEGAATLAVKVLPRKQPPVQPMKSTPAHLIAIREATLPVTRPPTEAVKSGINHLKAVKADVPPPPVVQVPVPPPPPVIVQPPVPPRRFSKSNTDHLNAINGQVTVPVVPKPGQGTGGNSKGRGKQSNTAHLRAVTPPVGKDLKTPVVGSAVGIVGTITTKPKKTKSASNTVHFNSVGGVNGPRKPNTGTIKIPIRPGHGNGRESSTNHFNGVKPGGKPGNPGKPLTPPAGGRFSGLVPTPPPRPGGLTPVISTIRHADAVKTPGIVAHEEIWVPTVQTMRDYVDYLIYVSNKFTFFKDLCKKHSIAQAKTTFVTGLLTDAQIGLYPKYNLRDRPAIQRFITVALNKISEEFGKLYENPGMTCSCFDILKRVNGQPAVVKQFTDLISNTCPNTALVVRPVSPKKPLRKPLVFNRNLVKKSGRVDTRTTVEEIDAEIMSME